MKKGAATGLRMHTGEPGGREGGSEVRIEGKREARHECEAAQLGAAEETKRGWQLRSGVAMDRVLAIAMKVKRAARGRDGEGSPCCSGVSRAGEHTLHHCCALGPTCAETAMPRVLEADKVSDYLLWTVLRQFGLINLGQLGPEATAFAGLVKALCRWMGVPLKPVVVCLHIRVPEALHVADGRPQCKATSEAVARTRNSFAFVDVLGCLAQDDCDEMLVIRPDKSAT